VVNPVSTVVTVTMNPALDVSTDADKVSPGEKIRCGPTVLDPGGGGVNVSRVVSALGEATRAVFPVGGLTGDVYRQLVEQEKLPATMVPISGQTRESFTVTETSTGQQYRFVLAGPTLDDDEVVGILSILDETLSAGDWLVASGSLPPGVPTDFYGQLASTYQARQVRVIVDTAPPWLEPAVSAGVYLVKPSRHELEEYLGRELADQEAQVQGAREMIEGSKAEVVALSLGRQGALLVTESNAWHAVAPGVTPVSTVGAGDSFLAGLVTALHAGKGFEEALIQAVAAGTATAMTPATKLCDKESVAAVASRVVSTTL